MKHTKADIRENILLKIDLNRAKLQRNIIFSTCFVSFFRCTGSFNFILSFLDVQGLPNVYQYPGDVTETSIAQMKKTKKTVKELLVMIGNLIVEVNKILDYAIIYT